MSRTLSRHRDPGRLTARIALFAMLTLCLGATDCSSIVRENQKQGQKAALSAPAPTPAPERDHGGY